MRRLLDAYQKFESRYLLLFVVLLLALLLLPFVNEDQLLPNLLYTAIPIAAIYASSYSARYLVVALVIGAPAILTRVLATVGLDFIPMPVTVLSGMIFYLFTVVAILQRIFRGRKITRDTLYGALSVYLLLGVTWSFAYGMVALHDPGAFHSSTVQNFDPADDRVDFLYYSFVTMTTLGYGDITPLTPVARTLSILQAITGVLFTATLVARLVGGLGGASNNDQSKPAS